MMPSGRCPRRQNKARPGQLRGWTGVSDPEVLGLLRFRELNVCLLKILVNVGEFEEMACLLESVFTDRFPSLLRKLLGLKIVSCSCSP